MAESIMSFELLLFFLEDSCISFIPNPPQNSTKMQIHKRSLVALKGRSMSNKRSQLCVSLGITTNQLKAVNISDQIPFVKVQSKKNCWTVSLLIWQRQDHEGDKISQGQRFYSLSNIHNRN